MADEIEKEEVVEEEVEKTDESADDPESSSTEDIDWQALAEAEKERADAAEALIVKNKNIQKRQEKKVEEKPSLTEERVLELIKSIKPDADDPAEKALEEAKRKLKELEGKNAELARAAKKKATTRSDGTEGHRDGEKPTTPKLSDGSPLKDYEYKGNRIYAKKLASGQTHYVRKDPMPGEKRSWVG